jgi:hypothetical protein
MKPTNRRKWSWDDRPEPTEQAFQICLCPHCGHFPMIGYYRSDTVIDGQKVCIVCAYLRTLQTA